MKIKTLSVRSSIEIGRFQHLHIEATADVTGNTPEATLDELKQFVADQLIRARLGDKPQPRPKQGRFNDMLQVSSDTWQRERRF